MTSWARAAGFEVLDTFVLPAPAWWDEYYRPLQARIESLRARARADADLATAIAETEREMSLYARHGSSYGYVFYLLQARERIRAPGCGPSPGRDAR